ncbi:NYN domain-containing protein [Microcoleus sp. Pol11C1]|uniref:NYN domain-containing protein n=1 Tax=unclassified Microcoleus TaxID=2642155 RepID=UPI002FD219F6
MFIFEQTHRQRSINPRCAICRGCPVNLFVGHNQMTDNHRTSNPSTDQQQALVSIYWDYENIPNAKQAKNLLIFAASLGYVVTRKVYDKNWHQENKGSQKRQQTFVNLGFECVEVFQKIDNAVDFSLFFDCSGEAAISLYPHTFIIVSGDGNGEILIPKLQNKGKKVIILARPGNENKNLERLANEFYFVNELPKLLESYKRAA